MGRESPAIPVGGASVSRSGEGPMVGGGGEGAGAGGTAGEGKGLGRGKGGVREVLREKGRVGVREGGLGGRRSRRGRDGPSTHLN